MSYKRKLKADFHIHTQEDPKDRIRYSARELIDYASHRRFDVLAITNHNVVTYSRELREYARRKGILLIPGIEVSVERKHVILLNREDFSRDQTKTLEDIRQYRDDDSLIIAPHPYFPIFQGLRSSLDRAIDIFDAIEYTHFYFKGINFNRKAERKAARFNLPLLGVSDAHFLWQVGTTYSLIEAEKDIRSVIRAIKKKRIEIISSPMRFTSSNVGLGLRHLAGQVFNHKYWFKTGC
jgi:hypothetical protein